MREVTGTLTSKSQVTIPLAARKALGLKPRDKVTFHIEGNVVRIERARSGIDATAGIISPLNRPEDWRRVRDEFERAVADEVSSDEEEGRAQAEQ